jgi:hypothetical protein
MTVMRRIGLNSTALALIPLAIALNIAGGQLIKTLRLPIYLDSIGTVLTGALFGPWVGLLTGLLSNTIWTLIGLDAYALSFAPVAGAIGLIAGFAGRAGLFQRESPRWVSAFVGALFASALTLLVMAFVYATPNPDDPSLLVFASPQTLFANPALLMILVSLAFIGGVGGFMLIKRGGYIGLVGIGTGIIAAILSAPIATYVFGGLTGGGTDFLVAFFQSTGASILQSAFAQGVTSDPFDKLTSFMVVWLILQSLPRRVLSRFPYGLSSDPLPREGIRV